jgi:pentalenolactone synthase
VTVQLPFEQDHPLEVAPVLRQLQHDGVIHRVSTRLGDPAWLVTGYDEVRRLLADQRLGRSHPDPDSAASWRGVMFRMPSANFDTEQADVARRFALLRPLFSPRRIRELRPRVEELTAALLDDLARQGPPADLQQALALTLPIEVICELLGVPHADRGQFYAWSEATVDTGDRAPSEQGMAELYRYCLRLAASKRRQPGDDVISRLCAEDLGDGEIATLSMMLLTAGQTTTMTAIGMGVLCLLANPDQWQALADDPAQVTAAVEEILRALGRGIPRYARTSLQIGGVNVAAGDLVLLDTSAANHDPEVFSCPGRFDIARNGPEHLAFGHGGRYCPGAPLARTELQAVFSQLPARFPAMRLTVPARQLRLHPSALTELPVEW